MTSYIRKSMRPYQVKAAVEARKIGNPLIADQPGLGKTIETLGTIIAHSAKSERTQEWHLIVCPNVAVLNVWEPEIRKWLHDQDIDVVALSSDMSLAQRARRLAEYDPPPWIRHIFVVTNLESLRIASFTDPESDKTTWPTKTEYHVVPGHEYVDRTDIKIVIAGPRIPQLFHRVWNTVVVDESHRALIRTKGQPSQIRAGFTRLQSLRRIALSGTPMRGKPEQLWGTLNWLEPKVYTSYWRWVEKYFLLTSNGFSKYVLAGHAPGGKKRMARDLQSIMIRRTKREVAPELPAKQYAGRHLLPDDPHSPVGIWLKPTPKQKRQLKDFDAEGVVFDGEEESIANGVLAVYTRARQLAGAYHEVVPNPAYARYMAKRKAGTLRPNAKVPPDTILRPTTESPKYEWIKDFIEQLDGERVVIASQFTGLINAFAEGLKAEGVASYVLTGETPERARKRMIDDFQSDDPERTVFFLNTQAGGVAVTLDMADYLVMLDETTIPDEQEQVEDRIHRVSRIHRVTIYYLRTLGTLDEETSWVAAAREDVQKYLLDGARGVEYAKQLYIEKKKKNTKRKRRAH